MLFSGRSQLCFVPFTARIRVKQQIWILLAIKAYKYEVITLCQGAVFEIIGRSRTVRALPDCLCVVTKINGHAIVEYTQRALP